MSHVAIYKWIRKYIGLMENYLEKIKQMSGTLGELTNFFKVKGDMKYLYSLNALVYSL
jgi:hypothetical protein